MNTKSYTIVVTADGFTIMETKIFWHIDGSGNHSVASMRVSNVETLRYDAGNTYEDAENRLRGWYRAASIAMQGATGQ